MNAAEFAALQPGDKIRSFVQPDRVFTVSKKTAYGYQIREAGAKRPGKAITPGAWSKVSP